MLYLPILIRIYILFRPCWSGRIGKYLVVPVDYDNYLELKAIKMHSVLL